MVYGKYFGWRRVFVGDRLPSLQSFRGRSEDLSLRVLVCSKFRTSGAVRAKDDSDLTGGQTRTKDVSGSRSHKTLSWKSLPERFPDIGTGVPRG